MTEPKRKERIRIFDSDPGQAVSVTVGDLKRLYSKSWLCGAHDDIDNDPIIHERTCHWEWSVFGSEPDTWEGWNCSVCGEMGDELSEIPNFCPSCGAKVVG